MSVRSGSVPPSPHLIIASVDASARVKEPCYCDVCGAEIVGEPAGRGLLLWSRGEELRTEEPMLCKACAPAITAAGGMMWADEEDE